jgi:hypothetical protein
MCLLHVCRLIAELVEQVVELHVRPWHWQVVPANLSALHDASPYFGTERGIRTA